MIRPATMADAAAICGIYNHYVLNTVITFEEQPVGESEMASRITETTAAFPWLVWDDGTHVLGYAYATKWRVRSAYRFSCETTVYAQHDQTGRGLGTQLYTRLLERLSEIGIHVAIGGLALPNAASQKLHERLGFKQVAHFEQVGWKFGRWVDVAYYERILAGAVPTNPN